MAETTELAYLQRREAHCRKMAEMASEPWARKCHLDLADAFARAIDTITASRRPNP
ncbi:MAG TPA: hypothetical protein VF509_00405 [Sphingobium sp.]